MNQTTQQEQGAAPARPEPRKHWELFWRVIATLMLLVIAWVVWVLYQISPRSVVTPLVYESQVKRGSTQPPATGVHGTIGSAQGSAQPTAAAPADQAGAAAAPPPPPQASPEAAAAAVAMDEAQAAARSGAHQASADIQAAGLKKKEEPAQKLESIERDGLKLSPEISTPLLGKERIPKQ